MFEHIFSFWRRLLSQGPQPERSEDERRLWVRYPAQLNTTVSPTSNSESMRLLSQIRNISRGGVHLRVHHAFKPGEHIAIELPLEANGRTQTVLACIMRAVEEEPGVWALGCIFAQELTDGDLAALGGQRVKHDPGDQRTWVRFATSVHAHFQKVSDEGNVKYGARVFNVSASGVGLEVKERIDTGALLSVELLDEKETLRSTMLACVVRVAPSQAGGWDLGCNFIRSLSEEDLRGLV